MNIIVTGNMGYVGPAVVQRLRSIHPTARIIGLDIGYFATCLLDPSVLPEIGVDEQRFVDVRHLPPDLFDGIDAVVHLAGISNDPVGNLFASVTLDVNYTATLQLAHRAKAAGVRSFVYASSCSVYGTAEDGPRTELSQVNPLTAYATSKIRSELGLAELARETFVVTCLRFATACGLSPRLRLDLVLNDFVAGAVSRHQIQILSDGTPWRPLIDVSDMARAVEWAVTRPPEPGGQFLVVNVGNDQWTYQVRELAEAVARQIPGTSIVINPAGQPDKRSYRVDFRLFRRLAPTHQPQATLQNTIVQMKQGLESAGAADPTFQPAKFIRLKVLSDLLNRGYLGPDLSWSQDLLLTRKRSVSVHDRTGQQPANANSLIGSGIL